MAGPTSMESTLSQPASRVTWQRDASILIVDDEVSIQKLLAAVLQSDGYRVRSVGTAREALAALKQSPVALMITDVKLPDQDGLSLLQQASELDQRMMGVVMTGYATVDLAVKAMKAGAAEFLMKPFQCDAVLMTVKRLLELYRLRVENAVLKQVVVRDGGVRLQNPSLIDFGTGAQFVTANGPSDFDLGIIEGERRAAARDQAVQRREHTLFTDAVQQLDEVWRSFSRTMESDVTALAFSLAARILKDIAIERQDVVAAQLKAALATIRESGVVTVRTHPADVPVLEAARPELSRDREPALVLRIEGDASLARGSCVVHTTNRLVDASLDAQLLRLGEALQKRGRSGSR